MATKFSVLGLTASQTSEQAPGHSHGQAERHESKTDESGSNGHKEHPIFEAIKAGRIMWRPVAILVVAIQDKRTCHSMLIPVQTVVETMGPETLSMRDSKGHIPAHWACLGGHTAILRFIVENKGPINEPSNNDLGARPIHWACVNGHIAIADILIQAGVPLDCTDSKGCTPLIVAAQYGQTMLAGYLMGKGARLQMVDKDGDNALHWAAFKGFSELMRLLIYSGFNPRQKDNFGQTPLHLACINGNLTAVKELCEQDGVDINLADKNGKTPFMLSTGRKHVEVIAYLKSEMKYRTSFLPRIDFWSIVFGPPGNHKGPILFFFVNILCWGYPMYAFKCFPYTWNDLMIAHVLFFIMNFIMWVCLFHASTTDPGYLPRNIPEYDLAIKQVAHFDEWKQGDNPLSRLCHTCRTVKTVRSKHCKICNRCVKVFDHHCPYIYNCVGYNNRLSFLGFSWTVMVNGILSLYFTYYYMQKTGEAWNIVYIFYVIVMLFFEGVATYIFGYTILIAALNTTTNEQKNFKRYTYLKDKDGKYHNPYTRGWKQNLLEFAFVLPIPRECDDVIEGDFSTKLM